MRVGIDRQLATVPLEYGVNLNALIFETASTVLEEGLAS